MRLIFSIGAAALMLPTLVYAHRTEGEPQPSAVINNRDQDKRFTENRGNFAPGAGSTTGQGRALMIHPAPIHIVIGTVTQNNEKALTLRSASGEKTYDVRTLAFSRSVNPGEQVQLALGDDQKPTAIFGANDSASAPPIAAEPTP